MTLLHATENVGPYRLIQQVMDDTDYDAYLFQDADDWSAPERLERLLEGAESTGAELIGSQEVRVFCDEPEAVPIALAARRQRTVRRARDGVLLPAPDVARLTGSGDGASAASRPACASAAMRSSCAGRTGSRPSRTCRTTGTSGESDRAR